MYKTLALLFLASGIALGSLAHAADASPENVTSTPRKKAAGGSERIRAVAEVVAIDMGTRTVTLKRDDGNTLTVVADARVKNLAQVRAGDFVVAEYGRATAISLKKDPGIRSDAETAPVSTAKPGKKPSVSGPRKRVIVADIIAIDDKKGQATLKGSKENVVDIVVKNPKTLAAVQVGDRVELTYTEAVAVSIRPARTKK
jgi:hypothetical protein